MIETILNTLANCIKGIIQFDKSLKLMIQHPQAVIIAAAQEGCYVTEYLCIDSETDHYQYNVTDYEPENQSNGKLITDSMLIAMPNGSFITYAKFTKLLLESAQELKSFMETDNKDYE